MGRENRQLEVRLGEKGLLVGRLFISSGRRSGFAYDERWLASPDFFNLSPELQQVPGVQYPAGLFFLALEDTAPDSWGERVIRRAHAKLRRTGNIHEALMPVDFILWVDDAVRVGALRLFDVAQRCYLRSGSEHRHVPPLIELEAVLQASRALESGNESEQDLHYLLGRATSLGGARPKSTVIDLDGCLALGKFPSQADQRDVIRGEVLAMQLAGQAGIRAANCRVELIGDTAVAVVRRFDRTDSGGRVPYLSAASLLQSSGRDQEHAYTELVDVLLQVGADPMADIHELWRRLVFNYLICNTDDHLRNTAFLYDARSRGWRLSPAFDLNPMPGDLRESKTWLAEDTGPIDNKQMLMDAADYFRLNTSESVAIWGQVERAVANWKSLARQLDMGAADLADFGPAFLY